MIQTQERSRKGNRHGRGGSANEDFVPYGDGTRDGTCTAEEVVESGEAA